ncbi:MAG: chloride channel protein [Iamia sp.]
MGFGDGGDEGGVIGAGVGELRALVVRSRDLVLLTAAIGVLTGFSVAIFERLTIDVGLERVLEAPLWLKAGLPGLGLVLTALALRFVGPFATPSTADEYVKAVPDPDSRFPLRQVPAKVLASLATLGLGGAGGLEGPSVYMGSAVGVGLFGPFSRWLRGIDRRAALVAGAAAGVEAIFKAPATGAVFALEVPYQDDLAPRAVLPALVGAAAGYTSFVLVNGTERLFPASGASDLVLGDLAVAAVVGLTCGLGARAFAAVISAAKWLSAKVSPIPRVAAGAATMAVLVVASDLWFDVPSLALGPGYRSVDFALDPDRGLWIIAALATVRVLATASTVGGGGVAGLFIPLVVQGALTGRLMAGLVNADNQSLWVVVGVAAFLGAGYRVPLAAVMFVAEATGRPSFVVPGLLAATGAQLLMGSSSVSAFQRRRKDGHMEQRADLPIEQVLSTDPATASSDDSVALFFTEHVSLARRKAVPVVDGDGVFQGLVLLNDVLGIEPDEWPNVTLADVARRDVPVGRPDWNLGQALRAMIDGEVEHLPVVDARGRLRGVVTSDAIIDRSRLMDRLEGQGD